MAEVTKSGVPSHCTPPGRGGNWLPPLPIGEDIAAADACAIRSDGKIYKSDGTGTGVLGTTAAVHGFAPCAALFAQGEVLSLSYGNDINYATGLTVGTKLFLSDTVKGGLATIVGVKNTAAVAIVLPADPMLGDSRQRIHTMQSLI